ncbi:MAG: hypothetical protein ABH808_02505 [Candidatus Kuenenbacteria bacterium]
MLHIIQQDKKYIWTIISTLVVIGLAFNLFLWQIRFLGLSFLVIFFVINGLWLGQILKKILFEKEDAYFYFSKHRSIEIFSFLFGIFLLIYLISFLGAIFLIFYKFSLFQIPLVFGILTLIISFLIHLKIFAWHSVDDVIDVDKISLKKTKKYFEINFFIISLGLFFLFLVGLFLLYGARTGNYIQSPWDVIPKMYLYVYLIATLIVAFLIFSKQKIGFILFIIILHSFFLHAYLPIVYKTGFGENKWKHLGIEKQILNIEKDFAPLIENKEGGANQWALTIFLSKILNVNIFWADLLLLYLLWSIFIPLIFFELAKFLFQSFKGPPDDENDNYKKQRFLLLAAFLPSLFFSFQVYGSITTPIALGYLFFFFVLLFWLDYLVFKQKISLITAIILSLLMFFGYQINFILILIIGIGILVYNLKIKKIFFSQIQNINICYLIFIIWYLLLGICFLFLNNFTNSLGLITQNNLYQTQWNIQNFALLFSKHISIVINFCIFSLIIFGIFKIKKMSHLEVGKFLIVSFLILEFLNFISFYFTKEMKIFSKNIELGIVFFIIFLLSWGIYCFLNLESEWLTKKQKIIAVCFFLAFSSTVVYASGPNLKNSVTPNDLKVAEYIWQEIQNNPKELGHPCVLADEKFLLALEAISGRNIISGGFLNKNETKKDQLFKDITKNPSIRYMEAATEITQSLSCYLIIKEEQFKNLDVRKKIEEILESYKKIEKIYIFHYSI